MAKKSMFSGASKTADKVKTKQETNKSTQTQPPAALQAMVWYKKEDWDTLLEMFTDTEKLPPNYETWLKRAEDKKTEVEALGCTVLKVYIDPTNFKGWCESKGLEMNSEARAQMAIEVAQAQSFSM